MIVNNVEFARCYCSSYSCREAMKSRCPGDRKRWQIDSPEQYSVNRRLKVNPGLMQCRKGFEMSS